MAERTDKDYAIEFGEYLANAAERYVKASNDVWNVIVNDEAAADDRLLEVLSDARRGLGSAIYEFRKRAERAKAPPSTGNP